MQWSVDRRGAQSLPAEGPTSRMGGNCWSRGRKVRLLLGFAPVECRPSWAPPISMHTVLVFPATRAIGVKAHCLHGKTFKSEDDVPQKGGWADRGPQRWPSRSSQLIHWGVVACPALPLLRGGVVLLRGRCRSVELGRSRLGAECFFMVFAWSMYLDRAEWSGYSGSLGWRDPGVGTTASLHHHDTDPNQSGSPQRRIVESARDL